MRNMQFLILLIMFAGFVVQTQGRPQQAREDEGELERAEYEGNQGSSEDYMSDNSNERSPDVNRDNTFNQMKTAQQHDDSPTSYVYLPGNENQYDNLLDHEPENRKHLENDNHASDDEMPALSERRVLNPNLENESADDESENTPEPLVDSRYKHNKRNENNPKYDDTILSANEEENFYEDDRRQTNDRNGQLLKHKPLYIKRKANSIFNANRNRRQTSVDQHAKDIFEGEKIMDKKGELENDNEDNESAIKRNIKKLSREELEDLLNSLSDDKKALLRKIIDSKLESVNKREITKKAEAVEENNCLESGQSDFNKIEGGRSMDSSSPSVSVSSGDTTETTKNTVNEVSSSKNSESDNSPGKTDGKDELIDEHLSQQKEAMLEEEGHNTESKNVINIQDTSKNENKRETNSQYIPEFKSEGNNDEILGDAQYALMGNEMECAKDENWSELMKDESDLHKAYSNLYKRGVDNYANLDNIKSLEESFPNYDLVDSKSSNVQMTPLIRVKRTNRNRIKRGTEHCVSMKVPFFPGSLNDDPDDNEKSEFDDGGIFERASNYEKVGKDNHQNNAELKNNNNIIEHFNNNKNNYRSQSKNYIKVKTETENANIGSDTDNVLSNVEGVDDNLMYNNDLRKKRIADDTNLNDEMANNEVNDLTPKSPSSFIGSGKSNDLTQISFNDANCQESDAFGPISHSPDGELGRYKRIRRLKPSPVLRKQLQNTGLN